MKRRPPAKNAIKSLAEIRKSYTLGGLRRADLKPDAVAQFCDWMQQALEARLAEPTAMTLATADKQGRPSARIVLLKGVDERGFLFFSNYASRKAKELAENPIASLVLYWPELERQVRVTGTVAKSSREVSEKYFQSRPRGHKLGAWVSQQSEPIADRQVLEKRLAQLEAKFPDEVPLPPSWGGYVLSATEIEFWQGRPDRLHDRFRYTKQPGGKWLIERLAP